MLRFMQLDSVTLEGRLPLLSKCDQGLIAILGLDHKFIRRVLCPLTQRTSFHSCERSFDRNWSSFTNISRKLNRFTQYLLSSRALFARFFLRDLHQPVA